ncbi:MAG: T9SS type A sorting domain-containing protein [Bacteroidales bacterium]|nr:T9SS type A sorting domain-containing protein [Bacteroidales bacterium]
MKFNVLVIFVLLGISLTAQEYTVIGSYTKSDKIEKNKSADTLELPFFDDFSVKSKFAENFIDNDVTISVNSAVLPPSIGAAMFDAVDSDGDFFAGGYNASLVADKLTSKPINLLYPDNNSIYFSFFYQPQGFLDLPEANDSLVLQFFAPNQNKWTTVWSASNAQSDQDFKQVILNISDTSFLQKGFQFRFYNRISMPTNAYPSLVGNCDQWFVDYIYLDKNRSASDTVYHDVAFQYPIQFKIDDYQSIPYAHYLDNVAKGVLNQNYLVNFRNNDITTRDIDSLYIIFEQKLDLLENDTLFLGSYTFPSFNAFELVENDVNYQYPVSSYDEMNFTLRTHLITNTYDSVCNNVVEQHKEMSVVYAYDDGTAENGYGLLGTGTFYAHVAQKFNTYSPDYLTGIQIYLNKAFKEVQPYYFYAEVWNNDESTSRPGEKLYEQEGFDIDHNNLDDFQVFTFDEPVEVTDTFYIGWMKTYEEIMNVGLDLNSTENNYKYYNIYGDWQKSTIDGVLMIRPIFGNTDLAKITENELEINIFPNPASDILNIQLPVLPSQNANLIVYDFSGKVVFQEDFSGNYTSIDVANFPAGVYLIRVSFDEKVFSSKVIKN